MHKRVERKRGKKKRERKKRERGKEGGDRGKSWESELLPVCKGSSSQLNPVTYCSHSDETREGGKKEMEREGSGESPSRSVRGEVNRAERYHGFLKNNDRVTGRCRNPHSAGKMGKKEKKKKGGGGRGGKKLLTPAPPDFPYLPTTHSECGSGTAQVSLRKKREK